eukprot:5451429-Alexandrium_andersonii.AAC.1
MEGRRAMLLLGCLLWGVVWVAPDALALALMARSRAAFAESTSLRAALQEAKKEKMGRLEALNSFRQ